MSNLWRNEGYVISSRTREDSITVEAKSPNGEQAARIVFTFARFGRLFPADVSVGMDHQRKGLATAMYVHAERATGRRIIPDDIQTASARALWSQPGRPFGNARTRRQRR